MSTTTTKIDTEKWVVTHADGSVWSLYYVGPGAEASARQFQALNGGVLWKVIEHWESQS